jgi:hypothetical protein
MSQIYKSLLSGPVPPAVPTSFTTDVRDNSTASPGTAIPAANVLQLLGGSTSQDNANGIQTDANPNNGNSVFTELTNRITGSLTTTNATPTAIATFALGATPAVYTFDIQIACLNVTSVNGDGYFISGSIRTDGATATLCGTPDKIINEEVSDTADANLVVSGNNAVIQATGIAATTHDWRTVATYVRVV